MVSSYPVRFDVDFPPRPLGRLSTAFRAIVAIPIVVLLTMLSGETLRSDDSGGDARTLVIGGAAVFVPLVLMLVFRQKYPRWWFDWNLNLMRFSNRVTAYLALLDDRYPSTDEHQSVHLDYPYPDAQRLDMGSRTAPPAARRSTGSGRRAARGTRTRARRSAPARD